MHETRRTAAVLAVTLSTSGTALAQEADVAPSEAKPPVRHALLAAAGGSTSDLGGEIGYRLRLPSELQIGLALRGGAVRQGFVDGFPATDGRQLSGTGVVMIPLARRGPLSMDFRGGLGFRTAGFDAAGGPDASSSVVTSQIGVIGNARVASFLTVRTGFVNVLDVAVTPAGGIDALGQLLVLGAVLPVSDALQIFVDGETGGVFGYGGDGDKLVARAAIGLRWVSARDARTWTAF